MKLKMRLLLAALPLLIFTAWHGGAARAQTPPPPPAASQPKPTPHPATVVSDPAVRAGWKRYQFGDSPAFGVQMPSAPEASAERMPLSAGAAATVHLYISTNDGGVFGAARLDGLPVNVERATEAEKQRFFNNFIGGFVSGFQESLRKNNLDYQLQLLSPSRVKAGGFDAFQQDFTVGPFNGRSQLVFVGQGAFCVMAFWNPNSATATADRDAFFDSFKISGAPRTN